MLYISPKLSSFLQVSVTVPHSSQAIFMWHLLPHYFPLRPWSVRISRPLRYPWFVQMSMVDVLCNLVLISALLSMYACHFLFHLEINHATKRTYFYSALYSPVCFSVYKVASNDANTFILRLTFVQITRFRILPDRPTITWCADSNEPVSPRPWITL
jgi:hypothetical protein